MSRYLTDARLRAQAAHLGERDWEVLKEVANLRFMSGSQVAHLCFAGSGEPTADIRAARRALLRLNRLKVLGRLPRRIGGAQYGSAGYVYHLAPAGQRLCIQRGWQPERRVRRVAMPGQLFVRHTLAISELHARLVEGDRLGHFELLERTTEPDCWRRIDGLALKPDSYVRVGLDDFEDSYFIEVDRGTEGSRAIERQLKLYLAYHQSGQEQARRGVFPKVLWLATEPSRVEGIKEPIARLPRPDRELFAVSLFDDALSVFEDAGNKPLTHLTAPANPL